jgi:hypothetical protein
MPDRLIAIGAIRRSSAVLARLIQKIAPTANNTVVVLGEVTLMGAD